MTEQQQQSPKKLSKRNHCYFPPLCLIHFKWLILPGRVTFSGNGPIHHALNFSSCPTLISSLQGNLCPQPCLRLTRELQSVYLGNSCDAQVWEERAPAKHLQNQVHVTVEEIHPLLSPSSSWVTRTLCFQWKSNTACAIVTF